MTVYVNGVEGESSGRHVTRVITEKLARKRFNELLDSEHALGNRRPKGRDTPFSDAVCAFVHPIDPCIQRS